MIKKVNCIGGYSYTVTLPKEWVRDNNVTEVDVSVFEGSNLLLKPIRTNLEALKHEDNKK